MSDVLSQAQIDAMIAGFPADQASTASAPTAPPAEPARKVSSLPANGSLAARAVIGEPVVVQLGTTPGPVRQDGTRHPDMEALQARVSALESATAQSAAALRQMADQMQALYQHVGVLTNALGDAIRTLQATPGFGAQRSHKCPSCGATGTVAVPLACTSCGETSHVGYWP